MECKGRRNERLGTSGEVLIETSWNVKEKECSQYQFSEEVLIETSWNVKKDLAAVLFGVESVLIETSWNVKGYPMPFRCGRN